MFKNSGLEADESKWLALEHQIGCFAEENKFEHINELALKLEEIYSNENSLMVTKT